MSARQRFARRLLVGGCAGLFVVSAISIATIAALGVYATRSIQDNLENPIRRAAASQRILGYRDLPRGYEPAIGFSLPFLFEIGLIADSAPDGRAESQPTRAFLFARFERWLVGDERLRRVFEEEGDLAPALTDWTDGALQVTATAPLGRGRIVYRGMEAHYSAHRGELRIDRSRMKGVLAVFFVDCAPGQRPGLGAWLVPDPDSRVPADELDLTGTPADRDALAGFLSHFELCR